MTYLMLALPIIITVFFNMAIGHDPKNIKIGVVNNEIDIKHCANYTFKNNNNCFLDEKMYGSCQIIYQLHKRSYKVVSIVILSTKLILKTTLFNDPLNSLLISSLKKTYLKYNSNTLKRYLKHYSNKNSMKVIFKYYLI